MPVVIAIGIKVQSRIFSGLTETIGIPISYGHSVQPLKLSAPYDNNTGDNNNSFSFPSLPLA